MESEDRESLLGRLRKGTSRGSGFTSEGARAAVRKRWESGNAERTQRHVNLLLNAAAISPLTEAQRMQLQALLDAAHSGEIEDR
jgi:hypothetical protein